MKKVLLLSPPFERFMGLSRFYYHIGLASLAAVLDKAGIEVLVYDADYDINGKMLSSQELINNHNCYEKALEGYSNPIWQEIIGVIDEFKPDVIGITVLSVTLPSALHMIKLIRDKFPNVIIITGGVHATLCPKDLETVSDYVITNEGENVIVDVVNGIYEHGIIKGSRIMDLDSLPFPAIHRLYGVEKYKKRDLSIIMSGRGCSNACKFCNSSNLWHCTMYRKSTEYFIKEIQHLIDDYGINDFFITDDTFTCDKKWLLDFLKRIKPLNVTWRCFSRVDAIYDDIIDKMIESGCRHIKLGIESGSQRILDMINKGITVEEVLRANNILKEKNVEWSAYFIIGFPTETVEEIRETQKLIQRLSASSITVNVYTPLPKNRLCNEKADYTKHSFHSPNNNFTGCIEDDIFRELVKETIELAERNFNEHNVEGKEKFEDRRINSMSTGHKIFIMGDSIEDHIFVSSNRTHNINFAMNYDLFSRDIISSYTTNSGAHILYNLLVKFFGETNIDKTDELTSRTVSEWNEEKGQFYLSNHVGVMPKLKEIKFIPNKLRNLRKSDVVIIYNMNAEAENYVDENNNKICIVDLLNKAKSIIVRTCWNSKQYTSIVEEISNSQVANNTILLCNVNELRRGGFNIHKGVSWEQLVIETSNAIGSIARIDEFKAVVVCFNHEGCLLYEKGKKTLIYFCDEIEGDYVIKEKKRSFGPILTMQSILAIQQINSDCDVKLDRVLKKGLLIMRELISHGYDKTDDKIEYPYQHIIKCYREVNPDTHVKLQSINLDDYPLNEAFTLIKNTITSDTIYRVCKDIIVDGPSIKQAPYLRLGKLITFDRTEIEQLRSIHQSIKQYIRDSNITKPLSICVFGQPGSGKSFAVKQIAKSLKINEKAILEFNLSQMTTPQELFSAFHQIRDVSLKGDLPIAFFDEFDSKFEENKLGWLKYFLAPMQDGEFRENAIAHFIGRAIFVFAGGTCNSTQQFKEMQKDSQAKENKLPDFLSRIKGYLDITGPNPLPCSENAPNKPSECWRKSQELLTSNVANISKNEKRFIMSCASRAKCCTDDSYFLRRATLLRSMLEVKLHKGDGDKIEIEDNVIDAFLKVDKYLHGARSLEAIIQTSDISPSQKFTAACICSDFCDLYVTDDFEEYLNSYGEK